jgi:hypothetical protein
MQPVEAENPLAQNQRLYALGYRFFNGPIRDFDGFIDGTCNYYVLCSLAHRDGGEAWRILYTDEQTFFAGRWRLLHPVKDSEGLMFALPADLKANPHLYDFKADAFWCPLENNLVDATSRLAVSRQVILVTGKESGPQELYSINFSWGTCDKTWRWRKYPKGAVTKYGAGVEVSSAEPERVYPQTIRLREDMTIAVAGTHQLSDAPVEGWWFQRYLPSSNRHAPEFWPDAPKGENGRPAESYSHPWQFLSDAAFRRADAFSHFGVYDTVNARSQYYLLDVDAETGRAIDAAGPDACWEADPKQLFVNTTRFNWHALNWRGDRKLDLNIALGAAEGALWKGVTTLYEPGDDARARLKLLNRGEMGYIAVLWDKRDDDLPSFSGLPRPVTLRLRGNPNKRVKVVVQSHVEVWDPPVVQRAHVELGREQNGQVQVTLGFQSSMSPWRLVENIWRVRGAALPEDITPEHLLNVRRSQFTRGADGIYRYSWSAPKEAARYLTPEGRARFATSFWFEDVVGHVAPPELLE